MFHPLLFVILLHSGCGGIPLHYEVSEESGDNEKYLEEFNVITKQKQYHAYSPEVPNIQVRKLSESAGRYFFLGSFEVPSGTGWVSLPQVGVSSILGP